MERLIILALTLLFSVSVTAMDDGGWFSEWYFDEQQQMQQMEQRQKQVLTVEETRCQRKIRKYQEKHGEALVEDPDEEHYLTRYYSWKLDSWMKKCQGE